MDYRELALQMLENWQMHSKVAYKSFNKLDSNSIILICIEQNPEATPKAIGELLGVSPPRITKALGELAQEGLIVRETSDEDRRHVLLGLTELGKEHLINQREEYVKTMCKLLEALGEQDAKDYVRIQLKISKIKMEKCKSW